MSSMEWMARLSPEEAARRAQTSRVGTREPRPGRLYRAVEIRVQSREPQPRLMHTLVDAMLVECDDHWPEDDREHLRSLAEHAEGLPLDPEQEVWRALLVVDWLYREHPSIWLTCAALDQDREPLREASVREPADAILAWQRLVDLWPTIALGPDRPGQPVVHGDALWSRSVAMQRPGVAAAIQARAARVALLGGPFVPPTGVVEDIAMLCAARIAAGALANSPEGRIDDGAALVGHVAQIVRRSELGMLRRLIG